MGKIIVYQLVWLIAILVAIVSPNLINLPKWYLENTLFAKCAYFGALGGVLYCMRGIYLNRCVLKRWDPEWHVWYYLRPITSLISGFVSCIFLKAGLLVLEASDSIGDTTYGYIAIAFIAGYNVDNFMKKIESIAQTVWGISQSKASTESKSSNDKE